MKSTINLGYLVFLSVVAALGGFLFGHLYNRYKEYFNIK